MQQDDCAITPVISESSANFIEGLVKDAEEKGATLCQKYKRDNNLIWPVLIDHVTAVCLTNNPAQTNFLAFPVVFFWLHAVFTIFNVMFCKQL